jgi:hypothetical protein
MREQIQKLLHATPFEPFAVEVAEDLAWSIPTPDHALAAKSALVIEDDEGFVHLVSYAHVRQIMHKAAA